MDGRTQLPVNAWMRERFGAEFVDTITEPGPNGILAVRADSAAVESILARVRISVEGHGSSAVAVVGHHDCAGNPADETTQLAQVRDAVAVIGEQFPGVEVIGLWVDEDWQVEELT
jgi:carbonic anhydrase